MSWSKLDDSLSDHPKAVAAGVALGLWARCLAWCAKHHTDGQIPHRVALTFGSCIAADPFCSAAPVDLCERLVEVGLWTSTAAGYAVHDYADYHESRAEWQARTAVETARKAAYRAKTRDGRGTDGGQGAGQTAGHPTDGARCPGGTNNGTPRARIPAGARPSPSPSPRSESEAEVGTILPEQNAPAVPALTLAAPKAKREKPPLPFRAVAALEAVKAAAGDRFAFAADLLGPKQVIPLEAVIRKRPDLAAWSGLGEWLTSPQNWRPQPVGVPELLANVGAWFAAAEAWREAGKPTTRMGSKPTVTRATTPAATKEDFDGGPRTL